MNLYVLTICRFSPINASSIELKNLSNGYFQQSLKPHVTIYQCTVNIFSLLIGFMGLLLNGMTLKVCVNQIMWERAYSRSVVAIAGCDILFIITTIVAIIIPTIVQYTSTMTSTQDVQLLTIYRD